MGWARDAAGGGVYGVVSGPVRLVIGVLALIFVVPASAAVTTRAAQSMRMPAPDQFALTLGVLIAAGLVWWRRPNWLIHTTIHEACHALFCLCLGVRIRSFQATDGRGGAVIHTKVGPIRTTFIALAPYVFPLLLAPALGLRWWFYEPTSLRWILTFACGLLTVHHLHGLYHNIRINFWGRQADLTRAGKVLSIAAISSAHCLWAALWVSVLY